MSRAASYIFIFILFLSIAVSGPRTEANVGIDILGNAGSCSSNNVTGSTSSSTDGSSAEGVTSLDTGYPVSIPAPLAKGADSIDPSRWSLWLEARDCILSLKESNKGLIDGMINYFNFSIADSNLIEIALPMKSNYSHNWSLCTLWDYL